MKKQYVSQSSQVVTTFSFLIASTILGGCSQNYELATKSVNHSSSIIRDSGGGPGNPNAPICNPIGGAASANNHNGILAHLTYIPGDIAMARDNSSLNVAAFLPGAKDVVDISNPLYISQIYEPTVDFRAGFRDSNGNQLQDLQGNALVEYFSIQAQGLIGLNPGDSEGDYQFATISDDGSMLALDPNASGNFQSYINNDNTHSNRMGCANKTVNMKSGSALPYALQYFQAPRYRISFIMLWRKVSSGDLSDSACGTTFGDNDLFTQTASGPVPASGYQSILNRGWSVVPSANFYLANGATNPCVP